jgi:endonuclease/exonuclease/phosphatase family metal-dependent hydrolase
MKLHKRFPKAARAFVTLGLLGTITLGCEDSPLGPDASAVDYAPEAHLAFGRGHGAPTVMTWNVYVGADLDKVIGAQDPAQIPFLVAEAFQTLLATNFPERAEAIADQIQRMRPHLIGLQEISLIQRQSPGDAIVGGTTPAQDVVFDYLAILMDALAARGLDYRVAGVVENFDVEVPMIVDPSGPSFDDVRLTDFDVILARGDVETSRVAAVNYAVKLPVPTFGIELARGYVAVDARVGDRTYRFVNTHLEPAPIPDILPVQLAQAQELVGSLENEDLPILLVGDFNSPATDGATYQFLVSQGYVDVWTLNRLKGQGPGYTNPHPVDLRSDDIQLYQRIDLIFARSPAEHEEHEKHEDDDDYEDHEERSGVGPVFATLVGDEFDERTSSGMWPSDHAGVVARVRVRADD